ncbi:hypothetical protein [Streptomyces sp. HC307]|uniref:hypothetical protein n=1 Tax=Streptomyces flavusporus TaxID=3385496 RepID=UPI0039172308
MPRTRMPFGVTAQFPNRSGAMVNVAGWAIHEWYCDGCPARSKRGGSTDQAEIARQAQAHADACSGMPK